MPRSLEHIMTLQHPACTDVGAQRLHTLRSPTTALLSDTPNPLFTNFLSLSTLLTGLQTLLLQVELWLLSLHAFVVHPGQTWCSLCAVMLWFACVLSLCLSFLLISVLYPLCNDSYRSHVKFSLLSSSLAIAFVSQCSTCWGTSHVRQELKLTHVSSNVVYMPLDDTGRYSRFTRITRFFLRFFDNGLSQ